MAGKTSIIPAHNIASAIFLLRGRKIMLDEDLARMYGVMTKRLNEQVSRNIERFPDDFMFQLTQEEHESLKSQIATSKISGRGGRRKLPRCFTQEGVAMLSTVLNSKRAILVNIEIMRAFVKLSRILETHKELVHKLDEMEMKYDSKFQAVFAAIRQLMSDPAKLPPPPPAPPRPKIGF